MSATDIAGVITQRAAEATGLAAGTPVLVGTGDSGAEAISTGVFRPGDMMVQLGARRISSTLTDRMVDDARLWPRDVYHSRNLRDARGDQYGGCTSHRGCARGCIATPRRPGGHSGPVHIRHGAVCRRCGAECRWAPCACRTLRGKNTPLHGRGTWRLLWPGAGRLREPIWFAPPWKGVAYTVASHVDIIEREHGLPIGNIMLVEVEPESDLDFYRRRMRRLSLGCQGYSGCMLR